MIGGGGWGILSSAFEMSHLKKEGNPAICNHVDEPQRHYTKWNKPVAERQILYDLSYIWNLRYSSS